MRQRPALDQLSPSALGSTRNVIDHQHIAASWANAFCMIILHCFGFIFLGNTLAETWIAWVTKQKILSRPFRTEMRWQMSLAVFRLMISREGERLLCTIPFHRFKQVYLKFLTIVSLYKKHMVSIIPHASSHLHHIVDVPSCRDVLEKRWDEVQPN